MDFAKGQIGNAGQYGNYDASEDAGIVSVKLEAKVDLIVELKKLAAQTTNTLDDRMVDMVASALGYKEPTVSTVTSSAPSPDVSTDQGQG